MPNPRSPERWLSIGIRTAMPWPTVEVSTEYQGFGFRILPETDAFLPTLAVEFGTKKIDSEEALKALRRFMTAISWQEGHGLRETGWCEATTPVGVQKPPRTTIMTSGIDLANLSDPQGEQAKLALALYREALNSAGLPYGFLGMSRIIEILHKSWKDQVAWMNAHLSEVRDHEAREVIASLKKQSLDIGSHLYGSGRCAVAHAKNDPIINPDSSEDLSRMRDEFPLMKAFAELLIEKELGVKSQTTIWEEHLYELKGFKEVLPKAVLDEVLAETNRTVDISEIKTEFSVGMRERDPFPCFDRMVVVEAKMGNSVLHLKLESTSGPLWAIVALDFKNERLVFDPLYSLANKDDGTVAAVECAIACDRFVEAAILNCSPIVRDAGTNRILGYQSPYIPLNVDSGANLRSIGNRIARLEVELKKRKGYPKDQAT